MSDHPTHTAPTLGAILKAARGDLTLAQAGERIGVGRSAWHNREQACHPHTASAHLSRFYGVPYVAVEGPGWAFAGPARLVRARLFQSQE